MEKDKEIDITNKKLPDWSISFISGGCAGTIAKSATAPLDRVKILFQTNNPHYKYKGVLPTIISIYQKEGVKALWRGNSVTLLRIIPYASVQFMAYDYYNTLLLPNEKTKSSHPFLSMLSGSLAGTTAVCCTYPFDVLRTRMAAQVTNSPKEVPVYKSIPHGIGVMYKKGGFKTFFRGLIPTVQGIIPYAGVNFSTYETLKFYIMSNAKDSSDFQTVVSRLFCGGFAGAVGQTVSYPFDVVRRRRQAQGFVFGIKEMPWRGSFNMMWEIVETEGIVGLYKGITINYWKVVPMVSLSFTTFETVKGYLKEWSEGT